MWGGQDPELSNLLGWNVLEGAKELPYIYIHLAEAVVNPFWKALP